MNSITKRVSAACLALLMAASVGASSLPFSFSESGAVIVASAEGEQEQSAKEHYLAMLNEAKAISPDDYSADSYALFTKRLESYDRTLILSMYENPYTTYEYGKLCEGIKYAKSFLNADKAHSYYNELAALIEKGETLNKDDYTEESYNAFEEQFNSLKNGNFSLEKAAKVSDPVKLYENYLMMNYIPCFALLKDNSYTEIVLQDEKTGVKAYLNSNLIPEGCKLVVDKFDADNWDWINTDIPGDFKNAPTMCSSYEYYSVSIYDSFGNRVDIKDNYTITIPLSEKINIEKLSSKVIKNDTSAGAISTVSIDKEQREMTVLFRRNFRNFANGAGILIRDPIEAVDPLMLTNDGVYQVTANLAYYSDASRQSMANAALEHNTYLFKQGENIDICMNFNPIYILGPDTPAYCGGLWCDKGEKNDGQYYEDSEIVYSYHTNEDGSIRDNDIYNGITEINCPRTIMLHLVRDSFNDFRGYTLAVSSPTMAAMNSMPFEEVSKRWDELTCNLIISEPVFVDSLDNATKYLPTYDKSALRYEIDYSKSLDELDYTAESWQALMDVVDIAQAKYDGEATTTEEITEQVGLVQSARDALVIDDSEDGDKADLEALVAEAKKLNEDDYTNSSWSALQDALASAEKVLAKEHAKQPKIDAAKDALQSAIDALEKKPETGLDKDNLADGKYTVTAEMIKTDRKSKSMSNNAINHTVQLEVVDGEYFVTMQFKGLAVYDQFGYLKDLGYYDAGYTYNDYGIPQGTVIPAEVLSYYDVVNQYNSKDDLYPEKLRFKLVDKASADFVPLQVFVPIMEAIAEGTGTQDVLMSIDWSSLAAATDETPGTPDDPAPAKQSIAKATVKVSNKTYTGKALKPAVTVTLNGKTLKKGTDYTVSYKNNKKVGKATVTVKGKGSYTGTKSKAFIIKPAKMKIKAAKSTAKNKIKVTWTKAKGGVTGYQVQIALNKKFTKSKKTYTVKKASAASKTITKLKSGKKYFVRVRAYKTFGKKTYYGKYSAIKTVKVK